MLRQLDESYAPRVLVVFPQMPSDQLLAYLAESLQGSDYVGGTPSIERSVRSIERSLAENAKQGRHALVVVDEAQDLDNYHSLETIRLLLNFEHNAVAAMTVLLVGQPSLLPILDRMPELDERLAVKCLLRRLTLEETVSYIHHRLQATGCSREIFQADAPGSGAQLVAGRAPAHQPTLRSGSADRFCGRAISDQQRTDRSRFRGIGGGGTGICQAVPFRL